MIARIIQQSGNNTSTPSSTETTTNDDGVETRSNTSILGATRSIPVPSSYANGAFTSKSTDDVMMLLGGRNGGGVASSSSSSENIAAETISLVNCRHCHALFPKTCWRSASSATTPSSSFNEDPLGLTATGFPPAGEFCSGECFLTYRSERDAEAQAQRKEMMNRRGG